MRLQYKILFLELNSREIYNYVGPWDWRDSNDRIGRRRSIFDQKAEWYFNLEQDILENGFKNPILAVSGHMAKNDWAALPEYAKRQKAVCNILGGSRLFIAQKYNLTIPAIISDFSNTFDGMGTILSQPAEIINLFNEAPSRIIYGKRGLDLREIPTNIDK